MLVVKSLLCHHYSLRAKIQKTKSIIEITPTILKKCKLDFIRTLLINLHK